MKQIIFLFLLIIALCACSKAPNKHQTKVIFQVGALAGDPGGTIVFAQKQGSDEKLAVNVNSNSEIVLSNGTWNFYGLTWNGAQGLSGNLSCAFASKTFQGGAASIDLYSSQTACNDSAFSSSNYLFNNQPYSLSILSCHDLTSILSGSNTCSSGNSGISGSYIISLLDYRGFGFSGVNLLGGSVDSACIAATTAPLGGETNTGLLIPSGGTVFPMITRIRAFEGSSCSGTYEDFIFSSGLGQGLSAKAKTFNFSVSTMKVFLNHFPAGMTSVSWSKDKLVTDSDSTINVSGFVSGGKTPYTFSFYSGVGSISATGSYTGGSAGTATITVTDDIGQVAYLPIENVSPTTYDFTTSLPSPWTITRNSPSYGANGIGVLTYYSTANTPRFEGKPDSTPLGLLIEKGTSSNLLSGALNFSTGWSTVSAVATSSSSPTDPKGLTSAYSIHDDNTNGGNAGQISTSPYLAKSNTTSVFSVFAKAGSSSIVSLYVSVPGSSCSAGVFDLINGTSTTSGYCGGSADNFGMIPYTNGWYRLWVRHVDPSGSTWEARIFPAYNTTLTSSADITASGTAYFYGPEFEQGPALTSYLPGSTREPDVVAKSVNDVAQFEGTVYTEWFNQTTTTNQLGSIFIAGGLVANNHHILRDAANKIIFSINNTGTPIAQVTTPNAISVMGINKAAYAYDPINFHAGLNGIMTSTTASGTLPLLPSTMHAGSDGTGASFLNGHLRKIKIWQKALSKEVLELMTQ